MTDKEPVSVRSGVMCRAGAREFTEEGNLVKVNGHFFAKVNGHAPVSAEGKERRGDRLWRAAGLCGERKALMAIAICA